MTKVQHAFYRMAPHIVDFTVDDDGQISYAGRRFVFFHTDMFARLFEHMEAVAGPVIQSEIEDFGEAAGKQIASKMDASFRESTLLDAIKLFVQSGFDYQALKVLRRTDNQAMIEKILGLGMYDGWIGEVEINTYEDGEKMVVQAANTFESYSYGESEESQCVFLQGVIKGILAHYWNTDDLTVREDMCRCTGHDTCRMVVERGT